MTRHGYDRADHAHLEADSSRVLVQLYLPGEAESESHSRATEIVARVLAASDDDVEEAVARLLERFSARDGELERVLLEHADVVGSRVGSTDALGRARTLLLGAAFTAEFAVEGAALCNPSAILAPDQSGLGSGMVRVVVSLRGIGEGHISSIGFATAIIGPGVSWRFEPRELPLVAPTIGDAEWSREQLDAALRIDGRLSEVTSAVLAQLPIAFAGDEIEAAIAGLAPELLRGHEARRDVEAIRDVASAAYRVEFPLGSATSARVLVPLADDERGGIEDARFTLFRDEDGSTEYRATYTAYDGRTIASRMLLSADLRRFRTRRMSGAPAENKGMALFPRRVGGELLALSRTDGESISLARSEDGAHWSDLAVLHRPRQVWEVVQTGNCGPPIETPRGWLVLTHGVGPMRRYSIGALLLDLDRPETVLARLDEPILEADGALQDGYVPNVVYSCGAILIAGQVWIPFGIGDNRIGVQSIPLDALLDRMTAAAPR